MWSIESFGRIKKAMQKLMPIAVQHRSTTPLLSYECEREATTRACLKITDREWEKKIHFGLKIRHTNGHRVNKPPNSLWRRAARGRHVQPHDDYLLSGKFATGGLRNMERKEKYEKKKRRRDDRLDATREEWKSSGEVDYLFGIQRRHVRGILKR